MLSRFAAQRALMRWVPRSSLSTNSGAANAAAAAAAAENPERDLVNFPRRTRPIDRPKVRLGFLPEEWFTAFHDKTGVSGPYAFIGTVGTFLLSKEYFVIEHDFYAGLGLAIFFTALIGKFGPDTAAYINKELDNYEGKIGAVRQNEIDRCQAAIGEEEKSQVLASSYEQLIAARKENVALQLEAAYRERLQQAYSQVKLRLDYQLEKANVLRRTEQTHMVNWIINSVKSSITAKQEEEALKKCVADLKSLAVAK